jgi:hypothetical protein
VQIFTLGGIFCTPATRWSPAIFSTTRAVCVEALSIAGVELPIRPFVFTAQREYHDTRTSSIALNKVASNAAW